METYNKWSHISLSVLLRLCDSVSTTTTWLSHQSHDLPSSSAIPLRYCGDCVAGISVMGTLLSERASCAIPGLFTGSRLSESYAPFSTGAGACRWSLYAISFFRLLFKNQTTSPKTRRAPRAAPMPTPALAPVDRLLGTGVVVGMLGSPELDLVVVVEGPFDVLVDCCDVVP